MNLFIQVAVAGRDDPDIDLDGTVTARSLEFAVLDDPEQLALQLQRHSADFIKKKGAAVGLFQKSDLSVIRLADCTFPLPEELAFDTVRGQGCTVDRDHRHVFARTAAIDSTSDHTFTGAGLAKEQSGHIHGGNLLDLGEGKQKGGAATNHFTEVVLQSDLLLLVRAFLLAQGLQVSCHHTQLL
jgi:hypothetical protein